MSHNCNTYFKWLYCSGHIKKHTFFLSLLSPSSILFLFCKTAFPFFQFPSVTILCCVYIRIHLHRVCIAAYEMGKLTYSNSAFKPSFMSIKTCSIYVYTYVCAYELQIHFFFSYITTNKATDNNECNQTLKLPDKCTEFVIQTWDDNRFVCLSCLSQSALNKFFSCFFTISFYFAYIHIYVVFSLSPCFLVPKYDLAFGWLVCQNVR